MNILENQNKEITLFTGFLATLLCASFGVSVVSIKISLAGIGAFTTAALRFSIAVVVILLWALITNRPLMLKKGQIRQMLIKGLIFTVQLSFFYLGMSKTNASRGALIVNLQPFFLLFLAHYFIPGDRITKRKILGILMGFSGVALVFLEKEGVKSDFQLGDIFILSGTFIWACNMVYTKMIIHNYRPFQIVLYPMLIGIPFFFLGGILWDERMIFNLNHEVVLALLYQGVIVASFGFIAWNSLLKKHGAVSLHTYVFIMPVAGVLLSNLLLSEPITVKIMMALVLIATGIVVVHFRPKDLSIFPFRRGGI